MFYFLVLFVSLFLQGFSIDFTQFATADDLIKFESQRIDNFTTPESKAEGYLDRIPRSLKGITELLVNPVYLFPGQKVEEKEVEAAMMAILGKSGKVERISRNDTQGFATGFWLSFELSRAEDAAGKELPFYLMKLHLSARVKVMKTEESITLPIWSHELITEMSQKSLLEATKKVCEQFVSDFKFANSTSKPKIYAFP